MPLTALFPSRIVFNRLSTAFSTSFSSVYAVFDLYWTCIHVCLVCLVVYIFGGLCTHFVGVFLVSDLVHYNKVVCANIWNGQANRLEQSMSESETALRFVLKAYGLIDEDAIQRVLDVINTELVALEDQQYQDWVSRNSMALYDLVDVVGNQVGAHAQYSSLANKESFAAPSSGEEPWADDASKDGRW